MGDEPKGLANASLSTSRVVPQDGKPGDSMPPNRPLSGNDQQKGLDEAAARARPENGKR